MMFSAATRQMATAATTACRGGINNVRRPSSSLIAIGRNVRLKHRHCGSSSSSLVWRTLHTRRTMSTLDYESSIDNKKQSNNNGNGNGGIVLGVLRETYDPWERRAPLTPDHVNKLLRRVTPSLLSDIIVQPSSQRIFTNDDYVNAGAIINEDLSDADLILGVKRPKSIDNLLPDKAYMFFSHVIKGQPENMALLQRILDDNIQLFDYESIVESGGKKEESVNTTNAKKNKRLVAFGKYAGIAGMVDTFQVLGRRLLADGYSTPFLHCPPSYMSFDLNEIHSNVTNMGTRIAQYGLPSDLEPIIFAFTGKGGNVNNGVMEIFDLLPHEMISKEDIPTIRLREGSQKRVYGLMLEQEDLVQHKTSPDQPFNKQHYRENPNEYESIFHTTIAPHINVIINGMYWDERYPRLLTKDQTRNLFTTYEASTSSINKKPYLSVVSDISCDVNGSIEFLDKTTSIDRPYFQYDPIQKSVSNCIDHHGITVMGVDILPSEVPREASTHFGNALVPLLEKLICTKSFYEKGGVANNDRSSQQQRILRFDEEESLLPPELYNACITSDGSLTRNFQYIEALMDRRQAAQKIPASASTAPDATDGTVLLLWLEGHLFDTGLINQILNIIEKHECHFELKECVFGRNEDDNTLHKSNVLLRVTSANENDLVNVESKVESLIHLFDKADATMKCYKRGGGGDGDGREDDDEIEVTTTTAAASTVVDAGSSLTSSSNVTVDESNVEETVLVLGSGLVSKSCVEFLGRSLKRRIVVASVDEDEAKTVANEARRGQGVGIDLMNDTQSDRLASMIDKADVVVSLLPATMHSKIAEVCIDKQTNLVTASYESDEMRALNERCANAGVSILNEVGLDPGLDHMSAMKIIDTIHERGGVISSFTSVCGGLPAPEAANNPLMYKFSWSPMGVLRASQNGATYLMDGDIVQVDGSDLLTSARPFDDAWPTLHLECLPNRDSTIYGKKYGINDVSTLFRGTLRYYGFSSLMNVFKNMGFFKDNGHQYYAVNWQELIHNLQKDQGYDNFDEFLISCANGDASKAKKAAACLDWLGMTGINGSNRMLQSNKSIVESFCDVLSEKLSFQENERDMVLMHTGIEATFDDDDDGLYVENHHSSLQLYGDSNMTAMCKTVGFTTAAATGLMLTDDKVQQQKGLILPTNRDIYLPMLQTLENEGIVFVENVSKVEPHHQSEEKHAF